MAGRKLTRTQNERIQAQQQQRIERMQKREESSDENALGPEERGLVVSRHGKRVGVEPENPRNPGEIVRCSIRATIDALVTGDEVVWRREAEAGESPQAGVVVARLPRRSELKRPDNYGKLKAIAANIDAVFIVFSPLPQPSSLMLDRYLVACETAALAPVIVLNKAELVDTPGYAEAQRLLALYAGIGYRTLACSSKSRAGLDTLLAELRGRTSVFVGQSGVGKSSLVNALVPDADLDTQEISDVSGLGQHTTTSARLFHLAGDGRLVDSPGVREFQLWHVTDAELERGYTDFRPFQGHCRFRDCRHLKEPGCALREAAARGELSAERLDNFLRIREGLKDAPAMR